MTPTTAVPAGTTPRVLVANRGEIAVRIVRACRELGYESVVAHSDVDADTLAVRTADRSICIGPSHAPSSYLAIDTLAAVALASNCHAVHPGYGFLAENADFADAVVDAGLAFVGPSGDAIRSMGDKITARQLAQRHDVPVVPGAELTDLGVGEALDAARSVGFPLLIKAAAGGGGRGIRIVADEGEFEDAHAEATSEARGVFGSAAVYLEHYVASARHVEVQVFGDGEGGVVVLGERDCSVQRRHQKLVEEAPCSVIAPAVRTRLVEAARSLAGGIDYAGAGTVEFLYDLEDEGIHFIEMNTRIQVEHPVTEVVHGVDLVAAQLTFAVTGEVELDEPTEQLPAVHAIECRVNAEHPRTMAPQPGPIEMLELPGGPGVRVDTHCTAGTVIPPYYDSMIAKVVVSAPTRPAAIRRMQRALGELRIEPLTTNIPLHLEVLASEAFRGGRHDTGWLERSGLLDDPEA